MGAIRRDASPITVIGDNATVKYVAHSELSRLAGGGAITLDDGVRTLRAVSVDMGFNDVSRADARAVYTVEPSTSAGGVFWNGEMSAD